MAVLPAFGLNSSRLLTPECCCCDLSAFFAVEVVTTAAAAAGVAAPVLAGVASLDGVAGRNDLRLGVLGKSDLLQARHHGMALSESILSIQHRP